MESWGSRRESDPYPYERGLYGRTFEYTGGPSRLRRGGRARLRRIGLPRGRPAPLMAPPDAGSAPPRFRSNRETADSQTGGAPTVVTWDVRGRSTTVAVTASWTGGRRRNSRTSDRRSAGVPGASHSNGTRRVGPALATRTTRTVPRSPPVGPTVHGPLINGSPGGGSFRQGTPVGHWSAVRRNRPGRTRR